MDAELLCNIAKIDQNEAMILRNLAKLSAEQVLELYHLLGLESCYSDTPIDSLEVLAKMTAQLAFHKLTEIFAAKMLEQQNG